MSKHVSLSVQFLNQQATDPVSARFPGAIQHRISQSFPYYRRQGRLIPRQEDWDRRKSFRSMSDKLQGMSIRVSWHGFNSRQGQVSLSPPRTHMYLRNWLQCSVMCTIHNLPRRESFLPVQRLRLQWVCVHWYTPSLVSTDTLHFDSAITIAFSYCSFNTIKRTHTPM
jgi:hypothetical protein